MRSVLCGAVAALCCCTSPRAGVTCRLLRLDRDVMAELILLVD